MPTMLSHQSIAKAASVLIRLVATIFLRFVSWESVS